MAFTRGDAKSSRQIGLTRLYCPHGTTQIIQLYRDREARKRQNSVFKFMARCLATQGIG